MTTTQLAWSSDRICEATGKQRLRQREAKETQWNARGSGVYLCQSCGGWHVTQELQHLGKMPIPKKPPVNDWLERCKEADKQRARERAYEEGKPTP